MPVQPLLFAVPCRQSLRWGKVLSGLILAAAGLLMLQPQAARAQAASAGTVEMIVPFAPGGAVDALARSFAKSMESRLKQTVVVLNKPGGSFVLAMAALNLAPATGQTFYYGPVTAVTVHPHWMKNLAFTKESFVPVCQTFENTFFLVGGPEAKFQNLGEVVAHAKANPGAVMYGHTGVSSSTHLAGAELFNKIGVQVTDIPYVGESPMQQHLMGKQLEYAMVTAAFVGSNPNMKPYVVFADQRLPAFPNVPTAKELGHNVTPSGYGGIFVKAGTPATVVQTLEAACKEVLADPGLQDMGRRLSQRLDFLDAKAFAARIDADHKAKAELLKTVKLER